MALSQGSFCFMPATGHAVCLSHASTLLLPLRPFPNWIAGLCRLTLSGRLCGWGYHAVYPLRVTRDTYSVDYFAIESLHKRSAGRVSAPKGMVRRILAPGGQADELP